MKKSKKSVLSLTKRMENFREILLNWTQYGGWEGIFGFALAGILSPADGSRPQYHVLYSQRTGVFSSHMPSRYDQVFRFHVENFKKRQPIQGKLTALEKIPYATKDEGFTNLLLENFHPLGIFLLEDRGRKDDLLEEVTTFLEMMYQVNFF